MVRSVNIDTKLCISIASRPGNFGTTVHNAAYEHLGLNFIYKAFGTDDLAGTVAGIKALGIRGCSVSMPFKENIIPFLDNMDPTARAIGAVNTIVNDDGRLTGYNTDAHAAEMALKQLGIEKQNRVLLLGAGGVARSIKYALLQLGATDVIVANRTYARAELLVDGTGFTAIPWSERDKTEPEVMINATSVGMEPNTNRMPVANHLVQSCKALIELVLSPMETVLTTTAIKLGKKVLHGYEVSVHQAAKQFQLYTGVEPPMETMMASIKALLQPITVNDETENSRRSPQWKTTISGF